LLDAQVSFLTLWDSKPGDGVGLTEHIAELVREITGRQPITINAATL
jgi:hypothetical protein